MSEPVRSSVRAGIVSASLGSIPNNERYSTRHLLEKCVGNNTGNLAFRHAVWEHVASETIHVRWDSDPRWVREQCDLLVIPSSNQANPKSDFSARADFIEAVDLPCLVLGLGAQAGTMEEKISFKAGTRRYLDAIAERSESLGVRGEFTAHVLAGIGIGNTTVIGCPSTFLSPDPLLGRSIEEKLRAASFDSLVVTAGDLDPAHGALEQKLFEWLRERRGAYICQSHPWLVALARQRFDELTSEEITDVAEYLRIAPPGPEPMLAIAKERFRTFFDIGEWLRFLSDADLAIGPRFHGNQLAMQAGTPGICICHDARTEELCRTILLPNVTAADVLSASRPEDLPALISFNAADYDARRADLASTYRALLSDSGVVPSSSLDALVGAVRSPA